MTLDVKPHLMRTFVENLPESQAPSLLNVVPLSEEICTGTQPVSYSSGEIQWPQPASSTYPSVLVLLSNLPSEKNDHLACPSAL